MDIFSILSALGGIALFLYGMNVMGTGLEKISGGKLEKTLENMTNRIFKAVLLGAVVTTIIQSSSATTVMVVGFVNSGLMQLSQAIGIIMGGNIGTTITSWILSLTGIESDNFFVQFLKPVSFAPVLAVIGVIFFLFSKNRKKKDVGSVLIGFSILMMGMSVMSDSVKPLADNPNFTRILLLFSNPIFGVIAGAAVTAVIQSSSASVGILQALSVTGGITYGSAIPIIVGQNLGTCVTAIISGIAANKNAKRAAFVHLYFNAIGAAVLLCVFYIVNYFVRFEFLDLPLNALGIAAVHTAFNLLSTALLLPFSKQLEKLAVLTVRDKSEKVNNNEKTLTIDQRLLNTPSFAVEQCRKITERMAVLSEKNLLMSIDSINNYSETASTEILKNEDIIDHYEDVLGTFLVKLSSKALSEKDSKGVSIILHSIGDFERISDHAVGILNSAKEMNEKGIVFSDRAKNELKVITDALKEILGITIECFTKNDTASASAVEPLEQVIDDLKDNLRGRHVERLKKGKCTIETGFVFSDLLSNFGRVSDHCSNIAVGIIQINDSVFATHEYLNEIKGAQDNAFVQKYDSYKNKYPLPAN